MKESAWYVKKESINNFGLWGKLLNTGRLVGLLQELLVVLSPSKFLGVLPF